PADDGGAQQDRNQDDRNREGVEHLICDPWAGSRVVHRNRGRGLRPARGPEEGEGHDRKQGGSREDRRELPQPHGGTVPPGSSMIVRRVSMIPNTRRTGTAPA